MVKFTCDCCGRSYSVAEDLRGRGFKMKCKLCGHLIVVKPSAVPMFPDATAAASASPAAGMPAGPPAAVSLEPPQAAEPMTAASRSPVAPAHAMEPTPSAPFSRSAPAVTDWGLSAPESPAGASREVTDPVPPPLPAPPSASTDWEQPPAGGYLDFLLDDQAGTRPPGGEPGGEATPGRSWPAAIGTPATPASAGSPQEPASDTGPGDPFAGWLSDEDPGGSRPAAEDASSDTEVTAPTAAVRAAPEATAPTSAPPARKQRGLPKELILGGAALVVAIGAGAAWLATRQTTPVAATVLVPGDPVAHRASEGIYAQMARPALAAPDPQFSRPGNRPEAKAAPADEANGLQDRVIAVPPPPPAPGEMPAANARPNGTKQAQIIASQRQAFDECTSQAVSRNPALRKANRKARLIVTVVPSGDITSARLDDPSLDEPQLSACLRRAAKRMVFPSFGGAPLLVEVPLSFAR